MNTRSVYKIDSLPVQQNRVFDTPEEAVDCPRGTLDLVQDLDTGLIHNAAFNPRLLTYDCNYQNEQAWSRAFQDHLEQVAGIVQRRFSGLDLAEIGCGKGWFLELLRTRGFRIIGIDPAYEGESPDVIRAPFTPGLGVKADALILRHVLEHIPDPLAFLASIAEANSRSGLVYIEVPCLDWICEHRAWFDIYYEHVNYFRLKDLCGMFGTVLESGRLFGGQYLYLVADLATLRCPSLRPGDFFALPGDFCATVDQAAALLAKRGERKAAVWGGSSKGVILTLFLNIRKIRPDFVIDINPAKQGKYLPATGLKISSPEDALSSMVEEDIIFVMNSNYMAEIKRQAGSHLKYYRMDHVEL
jgi:SAM-dependent methyltransferase